MRFWLVDVGFYYSPLSRLMMLYGFIGTLGMWAFIIAFLMNSLPFRVNTNYLLLCYFGISFLLFLGTYCRIRKYNSAKFIAPEQNEDSDKEMLSSSKILTQIDSNKKKTDSLNKKGLKFENRTFKALVGVFLTTLTFTTHSILYAYILLQDVQHSYHLIPTICVAFPVSLCLIFMAMMAGNILYNLWVDREFAKEYLQMQEFKKILLSLYLRMGIFFVRVAFASSMFTSFCGIIGGDSISVIVFVVLISIVGSFGIGITIFHYWPQIRKKIFHINSV